MSYIQGTLKVPTGILSCGRCCRELRVGFDMISHSQRLIRTWEGGWGETGQGKCLSHQQLHIDGCLYFDTECLAAI